MAGVELPLESLNVLIGPNGSGKSNLIDAISILRAAPRDLPKTLREGGSVGDWLWKGPPQSERGTLEVIAGPGWVATHQGKPLAVRYRLPLVAAGTNFIVIDERLENESSLPGYTKPYIYFGYENGRPMLSTRESGNPRGLQWEDVDTMQSILSQRKDPDSYPELTRFGSLLDGIRIYREWSFGRRATSRQPQQTDLPNFYLEESGANLGLVLSRFQRDPSIARSLLKELRNLYEGIDDFRIITEAGTVQTFLIEGDISVSATRLSDGTLRYLSLLAILCHPAPPPLVCIEEPELGLHPDLMRGLARLLVDASSRTQLVVTTHSDALIDALTDFPQFVVVCEKHGGKTSLRRLSKESLENWLDDYSLGQLWTSGEIGGNRW